MNVADIRKRFLDYFVAKGHTLVPSSSLVPANDPTLLFINSGMVQFKDVFLGAGQAAVQARDDVAALRARRRQAQRPRERRLHRAPPHVLRDARQLQLRRLLQARRDPLRVGAAHEGRTACPPEKLWTTVYTTTTRRSTSGRRRSACRPSAASASATTRARSYASDNFWQMADTGPCGPCSEIFYDHGPGVAGGPPGSPDADGDRYIEIWNLVFMQFNRDERGALHAAAQALRRHRHGPRAPRRGAAARALELRDRPLPDADQGGGARDATRRTSRARRCSVIADHIRACAFLIVDGVIPGNEGRGYVLRRIVRRAIRHGYKLGQKQPFFYRLVDGPRPRRWATPIRSSRRDKARVAQVLKAGRGALRRDARERHGASSSRRSPGDAKTLDGETAFTLYDTFGFPLDLTADIVPRARRRGRRGGLRRARWTRSASARARRRSSRRAARSSTPGRRRASAATTRCPRKAACVALYREGVAGRGARRRRARRRRARPHAVLRRVRRPGRRPRRAHQGRHVPHALRGRGHAEDPARRRRPPSAW